MDFVERYAASVGLSILPKTVLVEGTSDESLLKLAARLEQGHSGTDLFSGGFGVTAAGEGEAGGVKGVSRQLHVLRANAAVELGANGRPKYRFIGVFDSDQAGRQALSAARDLDKGLLQYRDLFLLRPVMPSSGSLDPASLAAQFEKANAAFSGLDWEIEDFVAPGVWEEFEKEQPNAVRRRVSKGDEIHRDLSWDGKHQFHKFVHKWANRTDLARVIGVLKALRFFFGLRGEPA